jgi:hypothetical protein
MNWLDIVLLILLLIDFEGLSWFFLVLELTYQ